MSEDLSSLGKTVPTLTGTDSFIKWRRAISAYLLGKGSLRVLEGFESEPFRRLIDPMLIGDNLIVRPLGQYAGALQPSAQQSTTNNALNGTQTQAWDDWEKKERTARSTILLTISPGIAAEVEHLWSAYEIFEYIKAEHRVDTIEHRGNLLWRIQTLRLSANATSDQMNDHYEAFISLVEKLYPQGHR